MGTGQAFVKWLKPAGCVLFLALFVVVTVILFTAKGVAVKGYDPPRSSEYYAEHLDEFKTELEDNLFPKLDAAAPEVELSGDRLGITCESGDTETIRLALIHYYDEDLFEIEERDAA